MDQLSNINFIPISAHVMVLGYYRNWEMVHACYADRLPSFLEGKY